MRWTNTWFWQGLELSRGAMQQFKLQQMATRQGQMPLYECRVHALLWPEKTTMTQLIARNVVDSQARVLFMSLGQLPPRWRVARGVAPGAGDEPGRAAAPQGPHGSAGAWDVAQAPQGEHGIQGIGKAANTSIPQDVGTDIRGSRARQPRKDATALLQMDCENASAHLHWKLALQQQVYSNENHRAMLVSQGHPAFGGDKNVFIMGRGKVATQDYAELVRGFFPASVFCSDPRAS